nr:glycosyltransferase family 2 protein [Gemmatimonadota bacterium]
MSIDLVVPVYNEEQTIPGFLENIENQTTSAGEKLPRGFVRVIVVDNGSTDSTVQIVEDQRKHGALAITLVHEPCKSHIAARIRGADYAIQSDTQSQRPLLVNCDVDTRYQATWIAEIAARLSRNSAVDVLSYAGYF